MDEREGGFSVLGSNFCSVGGTSSFSTHTHCDCDGSHASVSVSWVFTFFSHHP